MQHDGARLEQREIAVLIGRNLPERMQRPMRGLLHVAERKQTNIIGLADFLQRPANLHVAREPAAAVGGCSEGGDGGGSWRRAPGFRIPRTNDRRATRHARSPFLLFYAIFSLDYRKVRSRRRQC